MKWSQLRKSKTQPNDRCTRLPALPKAQHARLHCSEPKGVRPAGFRMRRLERGTVAGGFVYARHCQGHAGTHEMSRAAECLSVS